MDLNEIIKKHALKNALDFGKANPKSIVGKLIAEHPDAKKNMKQVMEQIIQITQEVNGMSKEQIEEQIKNYTYEEKKKEEKELTLPNAEKGKVVTRFPPEPSGYLHIGHAKALFLNRTLADNYDGKMVLRFDDTNPEKAKQEYVEKVKQAMDWLGIKSEMEYYSSDKIDLIYEYAEKILSLERAYICTCNADQIKQNRQDKKECACRAQTKEENLELWKKMLNKEMEKGKAIMRLKGDMESLNTVMRDPTLFRIIDSSHYRQGDKYTVWPSYDFTVSILDSTEGVTHSLRTKEYELRRELYFELLDILELRKPELIEYARLSIKGAPVSKRVIVSLVKEGKVDGWNDPRLPTLDGLKRRGILPKAIKNFVLRFGLTKAESEPDWEILLKENRKLIDPVSDHYFFVPDPVKLSFSKPLETKEVELSLNAKNPEKGKRTIPVSKEIYVPKQDYDSLNDGEIFRLKDLNIVKLDKKNNSLEVIEESKEKTKIVQWVSESKIECAVLQPSDLMIKGEYNPKSFNRINGFCEPSCKELKLGDLIQFERFGFVKLDKIDENSGKLTFVFSC